MRKIPIIRDYYDEGVYLFKKSKIELNPGLTVLVGCNGTGKTTLMNQIKTELKKNAVPYTSYDNLSDGRSAKQNALNSGEILLLANLATSSEGESIKLCITQIAQKIGQMVQKNPTSGEFWVFLDGVDSGLSIDNIIEIKKDLIHFILEMEKDKDFYFVVSANAYEFCNGENCYDVAKCSYITFADYDDYRSFVIKSSKNKEKRYEKDTKR